MRRRGVALHKRRRRGGPFEECSVSELLFLPGGIMIALEITAEMSQMTVAAVVATALREKAIGKPASRSIPDPRSFRQAGGAPCIGSPQKTLLDRLDAAAGEVHDLREIRRARVDYGHSQTSISRSISRLIRSGISESLRWSDSGFIAADPEAQIRFVRRK